MEKNRHCDCSNYENIDVTKGLCLLDEGFVPYDAEACPRFSRKPKCRYCRHYAEGSEEGTGVCSGLEDGEHWISGEMIAVTCDGYEGR